MTILLSISMVFLALVIIYLLDFPAKATDLSLNQNSNLRHSKINIMNNGSLQTLNSNYTNSSASALCSGSRSLNASRLLHCQEETSKASPEELSSSSIANDLHLTTTAALIAKDLRALSPSEIKEYGITDLSTDDLRMALNLLDKENLAKVLSNIPPEDLVSIRKKIGSSSFDPILEKLSQNDRINITKKIPQT